MRLDKFLLERFPLLTRTKIQDLIKRGCVSINNILLTKPGIEIKPKDFEQIICNDDQLYVSRAGLKLQAALDYFKIIVKDKIVLDAGISTGGFADCLLQKEAKHIYGIDVGFGQLHKSLIGNKKITLLEKTNLKTLTKLPEKVDLVTLDLSFISVTHVLEQVAKLMSEDNSQIIILIKPQFELTPQDIGKNGVVVDEKLHEIAKKRIIDCLEKNNFKVVGIIDSPILGSSGNKEFLCYATKL